MHPVTPETLRQYANAIAYEAALDARAPTCNLGDADHLLGARVDCPACWAWLAAQRQPSEDAADKMAAAMADDHALAGENDLRTVARCLLEVYRKAAPTEAGFFEKLADATARAQTHVSPTSRRRSAVGDYAAIFLSESYVPIC